MKIINWNYKFGIQLVNKVFDPSSKVFIATLQLSFSSTILQSKSSLIQEENVRKFEKLAWRSKRKCSKYSNLRSNGNPFRFGRSAWSDQRGCIKVHERRISCHVLRNISKNIFEREQGLWWGGKTTIYEPTWEKKRVDISSENRCSSEHHRVKEIRERKILLLIKVVFCYIYENFTKESTKLMSIFSQIENLSICRFYSCLQKNSFFSVSNMWILKVRPIWKKNS